MEIGLTIPGPYIRFQGLHEPIYRLVATGRDVPSNLALFFGPQDATKIEKQISDIRLHVLLCPPLGSSSYALAHHVGIFNSLPQSAWTSREASPQEQEQIQEVREMQEIIRLDTGTRGVVDITSDDRTGSILVKNFVDSWFEARAINTRALALSTMDLGVRV